MSNLPPEVPVTPVDEEESGEWQNVEPKFSKHRIRRGWEWVQDLFNMRTSAAVWDEVNAKWDDRSPDPTSGDSDGEPEPT